ncbi:MAG: choice-of-anchor R domain-containing protein [Anaerolineaceae bacterium]
MPVIVEPGSKTNTHHISLSDGEKTIGLILCDSKGQANPLGIARAPVQRTAMKTTSGNQKYSDFEPPYTPIAQDDWSGGRGELDFDRDVTRFYDSTRINSMFGKLFLAPQEVYTSGYRKDSKHLPGSVTWSALLPGSKNYLAARFVLPPGGGFTANNISLWVRRRGTPKASLTVQLRAHGVNAPGAVLQSTTITTSNITDIISEFFRVTIPPQALAESTNYWIVVTSTLGESDNHWQVAVENAAGNSMESADDTTWMNSSVDLYYRITDAGAGYGAKFFQYKYALYCLLQTNTIPKLFLNGDRGCADSNAGNLTKLIDATKAWKSDQWAGAIVQLIRGAGSNEVVNWRKIVSNTATELVVDSPWLIAHDTTTNYVIKGDDTFTEVTGHGLTVPVTSVLVTNDTCYFGQGDTVNLRRMRWYNNAGVAAYEFAEDGTNKATHLCTVRDTTNGLEIWRSNNIDASGYKSVSKAPVVDWGTNLTFAAPTNTTFKDDGGNINNIVEYGESTSKQLWIMREGPIYTVTSGKLDEIPLSELRTVAASTNGRAATIHNVYLLFNLGSGMERYYSRNLEDIGPNRFEGLTPEKRGVVSAILGYPGAYFIGYDGGSANYSTVLANNNAGTPGAGWHEYYRSPMKGDRILDLNFQTIPGSSPDRMWIAVGDDIVWLPFPSDNMDPNKDANMRCVHEGVITNGYMYAGLYNIYKFSYSITIFAERMAKNGQFVEIDYQTDDETEWHTIPDHFETSPISEQKLKKQYGVNGRRFRYRIRMQTNDSAKTPIIKSVVVDTISRVEVKYSYALSYRLQDNDVNLAKERDSITAAEKQAILDEWATKVTPLLMRSSKERFDDKTVYIDPQPLTPDAEYSEKYTSRLTAVEV